MTNGNIYSASADEVAGLFCDYLEGGSSAFVLALSARTLPDPAKAALEKSFEALGYGSDAVAYATLWPGSADAAAHAELGAELDAQALFLLIEGLDPVRLVACDEAAAASLEAAYRASAPRDARVRLLGRPCVLFSDFPALLESDAGKQRAWALLKALAS